MKILVTGSAGFLGFHLSKSLIKEGHEVFGIDNYIGGDSLNTFDLQEIGAYPNGKFTFVNADCTDFNRIQYLFNLFKPEIVYHMACFPHEGLSVCSPYKITHSVSMATMALLSASVQNNVKRFIFTSSMARYGYQEKVPFTESMVCSPQDPYGWAKFAAEGQIKSVCEAFGMEYVIAVPHNIYGPNQKYDDPFRNVAAIMCNRALQGKQPIIYGDGQQKRCFSYVSDLIPAFEKMAIQDNVVGEIINIGPEAPFITVNELSRHICNLAKLPWEPIYMEDRPREVKHANCSAALSMKLLDVSFKTDLIEGLNNLIQWIKLRGPKEFNYHLPIEINKEKTPLAWRERSHNK